ncbi:ribbon-helix-helix protein, CopG family [Agrobacterium tumefaciens]|nr:ribbon-helix-helix protein, CopG family [Agrobacterium tumefaciens]NSZ83616.1 ribbon-helix-helix protein, CopG family [Agrobacterium tumefaciens]WCA69823.1 ribbon-helix-helix protein, CopG family [Agrobacterium tumefaciens]
MTRKINIMVRLSSDEDKAVEELATKLNLGRAVLARKALLYLAQANGVRT